MRNLTLFFCFILTSLTALPVWASPAYLSRNAPLNLFDLESVVQFNLEQRGLDGMTIEINLPESSQILVNSGRFGSLLQVLTEYSDQNGALPFISRWVVIPDGYAVSGHVTANAGRRISLEQSYNAPVYLDQQEVQATQFVDTDQAMTSAVSVGRPVVYRGVHLAPIIVKPFQLSPESGEIFESTSLTFELELTPDNSARNVGFAAPYKGEFARTMERFILNPPARDLAESDRGKMVIMHSQLLEGEEEVEEALAAIQDFATWKRRLGFDVIVHQTDISVDNAQENIKAELREFYDDGSLDYLIIIGDYFTDDRLGMGEDSIYYYFPTYMIEGDSASYDGDQYFVTFDGDEDLLPDVILGRFMCRDTESLVYALQRTIKYEQDPEAGEWLTRALYSMGITDKPLVATQHALDMMHWTLPRLEQLGFEVVDTLVWGNEDLHMEEIREAYSEGASLGLGDGALKGIAITVLEGEDDDRHLVFYVSEVGEKHPFIIANLVYYTDPVTITLFNQGTMDEPNGCVAGFGLWHKDAVNHKMPYLLGWSVYGMRYLDIFEGGALFQFAGIQYQQVFDLVNFDDENELIELNLDGRLEEMAQYQYLGDPTIHIRTGAAVELSVDHPESYNNGATAVKLRVTDHEDQPMPGISVCILQADNFKYVSTTDGNGRVSFTVPEGLDMEHGDLSIVANGHNVVSFVGLIEVAEQDINIVLEAAGIDDSDGDDDGLFRNGETVVLDLSLTNSGNDDAADLTAAFSSDSEYLTFSADQMEIDVITAGETGGLAGDVEMTLAANCPGGKKIQIVVNVTSGDRSWLIGFEIVTSGPAFEIVGFERLGNNHGVANQMTPILQNNGDLISTQVAATLTTENPYVTIRAGESNYAEINVGADELPANAFSFITENKFIPGQMIDFTLTLIAGNDERTFDFTVGPISAAEDTDPVGPDKYGYMAFDSGDEADWTQTPVYHWREINRDADGEDEHFPGQMLEFEIYTDTTIVEIIENDSVIIDTSILILSAWDESILLPLPFEFQYYGESYDSFVVNTNGWMALGSDAINNRTPVPWGTPGIGAPDAQLSPYTLDLMRDDIHFNRIFYYYIEDEGIFVVEWSGMNVVNGAERYSFEFQVLLHSADFYATPTGDGEIVFQYRTIELVGGPNEDHLFPTIGIRSPDGTDGIQYSFNAGYSPGAREISDEFAIHFTTNRSRTIGSVSGVVVRAENDSAIAGAIIEPHWLFNLATDDQGAFELNDILVGRYPFTVRSPGYSTLTDTFEVVGGEVIQLDTIRLSFPMPTVSEETRSIERRLQPDAMVRADFILQNQGEGMLEYETTFRNVDGSALEFRPIEKTDIASLTRGDLEGAIRGFAPLYTDSFLFIPIQIGGERGDKYISKIDLDPDGADVVNFPMPIGEGDGDGIIKNLAWDGEYLWAAYYSQDFDNILFKFDTNGGAPTDTIILPAVNNNDNGIGLVFSPERNSMFVVNGEDYENIIEISLDSLDEENNVDIISENGIWFQGRSSQIFSLGWHADDPDNMPLYMLEGYWNWNNVDPNYLIAKLNPDNGDWKIVTYITDGIDNFWDAFGCSFLPGYSSDRNSIAFVEQWGAPQDALDTLVIRDFGPDMSFISQGSYRNKVGVISPGEELSIGFEIDAAGLLHDSVYRWSYYVTHNGFDDTLFVPCVLTIDINAGIDMEPTLPSEFGLHAIYPNPFNSMTRITFGIAEPRFTQLMVYDISGREVELLYSGEPSVGDHVIAWDAGMLSSGVYLLRLETEGMARTRKVVLMK